MNTSPIEFGNFDPNESLRSRGSADNEAWTHRRDQRPTPAHEVRNLKHPKTLLQSNAWSAVMTS